MTSKIRSTIIAAISAVALITPAIAVAQPRPCAPHDRHCAPAHPPKPHHPVKPGKPAPPKPGHHAHRPMAHPGAHHAPAIPHRHPPVRVGQSAAKGNPFHRGKNSRFNPPPRGQEYRVVNDHLVLADSRTLQIISVIGLLNQLIR